MRLALPLALLLGALATSVRAVELAPDVQRKLGVKTIQASAQRAGPTATGFARVLDVVPLATLDADLAAAKAAASASSAEAKRTRDLAAADATVSKRVAEAAAAQARADQLRFQLLQRRLQLEWGPAFAKMGEARRSALISSLAEGRSALVRLDAASGLAGASQISISRPGGGRVSVEILGPSRVGDPRFQAPGLLGLVKGAGASDLATGLVLPMSVSTGGAPGVLLPRSAVLRAGGETFVYVHTRGTHFDRRNLGRILSSPDGLVTVSGVRPGEAVVISGASVLYAAESQPKGEDE